MFIISNKLLGEDTCAGFAPSVSGIPLWWDGDLLWRQLGFLALTSQTFATGGLGASVSLALLVGGVCLFWDTQKIMFMTAALGGCQGGAWACWLPDVVAVGGHGAIGGARSHRTRCYFLEGWLTLESFSVAHIYHSGVSTDQLALPVWGMS